MRTRSLFLGILAIPLGLALGACPSETSQNTCDPACDESACLVCDTSGDAPVCRSACGDGLSCEAGQCVAPEVATCDPACGGCQVCDTTGESPVCTDLCGSGTTCQEGACVSDGSDACGGCGACQMCDVSGATPACVDLCGDGTSCDGGACVPTPSACEPACGPCEVCDDTGASPVCQTYCSEGTSCVDGICVPGAGVRQTFHANFDALQGPFASGPEVTAACLTCHQAEADAFMMTSHWNWTGPTPDLVNHPDDTAPYEFGKKNLINNFCISIAANEARCTQCHAGYGWKDPTFFDTATAEQVDCLVCHADPKSGYRKDPKGAGNVPVTADGAPAVDLVAAAGSVSTPVVQNCGACHFNAGGGDNVKKGDMGSALAGATRDIDVHLGSGLSCNNCHSGSNHTILGQGIHIPVSEQRVGCTDCHTATPHGDGAASAGSLDNHALDVACQTCHIPAFSRAQPTKMRWDWSTAGDKTHAVNTVNFPGGDREDYNWMKGSFEWQQNVRPAYAWYDGRVVHLTTGDSFPEGEGTQDNPVRIAYPVATLADAQAKIFPFKLMRGRQAADVSDRFLIAPDLFGPGSFWAVIGACDPTNADCNYAPDTTQGLALLNQNLTTGARAAGQIPATEAYGVERSFEFVDTLMYMGIDHEVAPKAEALGCGDCHGNAAFDFTALGYGCDPRSGSGCGNRH